MTTWLGLIETGGNQRYIFDSNRLKDAIGGSWRIVQAGDSAREAAKTYGGRVRLHVSGLVEAEFDDRTAARDWITDVTSRSVREDPGLDLAGAVVEVGGDWADARRRVRERLQRHRSWRPGPGARSIGSPWSQQCHYTGRPAVDETNPTPGERERGRCLSREVLSRRTEDVIREARKRIKASLEGKECDARFVKNIDDAVRTADEADAEAGAGENWRALVHVDGNALGRIFLDFERVVKEGATRSGEPEPSQGALIERLRGFSEALDAAAWKAFALAVTDLGRCMDTKGSGGTPLFLYPILVGGDDLTVVLDGRYGIYFAERFVSHFEVQTHAAASIRDLLERVAQYELVPGVHFDARVRACAGVAIFKSHFPFSIARQIADDLCRRAKASVRDVAASALDWHVVYDASPPELSAARAKEVVRDPAPPHEEARLTRRPYRVGVAAGGPNAWDGPRLEGVVRAAQTIGGRDVDSAGVPSTVLHALREALYEGRTVADRRYRLAATRDRAAQDAEGPRLVRVVRGLGGTEDTLFELDGTTWKTGLLDAMDGTLFFKGFATEGAPTEVRS